MCETCGVTTEQYDAARSVAMRSCIASFYEQRGADPIDYGQQPRPTPDETAVSNDHIQRYHAAHPGRDLTRDEMVAAFAERETR